MSSTASHSHPPDQPARNEALDPRRSFLVQAPAGSGKTDLLTRRLLRLLAEVDDPSQIVAITFTKAAAAEMRHRILDALERAASETGAAATDPSSMEFLAARALQRSQSLGWKLIDLPGQLRITTIDAFCREIALQQPLVSPLGSGLDIAGTPRELYRRAARRSLEQIGRGDPALVSAIESLLQWRDNGWQEIEDLLVEMLAKRDRWMQGFLVDREPDWPALRERLERPFARTVRGQLLRLNLLLDQVPGAREEALALARFACEDPGANSPVELAACTEIAPPRNAGEIESARTACASLAAFLQTQAGKWRSEKGLNSASGFPATDRGRAGKLRFAKLIAKLRTIGGLESALAEICALPPARFSDDDWYIVQACFQLLAHAAAQLKIVFAEHGGADYVEVAQTALSVLKGENGIPSDTALSVADGIRHLLVDEFQDTSRRQHELLRHLVAAWPDRESRTCFVVGDPMQSIYFFRDADAELFSRVKTNGLEIADEQPLLLDFVPLTANFRTARDLVRSLNSMFEAVFHVDDGSGIEFAHAEPARRDVTGTLVWTPPAAPQLHCTFMPASARGHNADRNQKERIRAEREAALHQEVEEVVALIRGHQVRMEAARASGQRYRIAVLGRTRSALTAIAAALHSVKIPFLAVDLEDLRKRPEILDAVALARALLNPHDRVAWLGVLRAPWCGLSLADLHLLVSADDLALQREAIPTLLRERGALLSTPGRMAVEHLRETAEFAADLRASHPSLTLGSWLAQVVERLGGDLCVDAASRANLDLLWTKLDNLSAGEQDLLGPAVDVALKDLKALPDPRADSECGVQLMTIHSAKGLEFEVVIVPELQAANRGAQFELLSWLERGLAESEDPDEITEFLVAPLQTKGADAGASRRFVNEARRQREEQEMRRLLYVAATRAREELHFFARPEFTTNAEGTRELADVTRSLLATGWPALEAGVRQQFEQWDLQAAPEREEGTLEQLAAAESSQPIDFPAPAKPVCLWRLPEELYRVVRLQNPSVVDRMSSSSAGPEYLRHEGGLRSRVLGSAVHALLQRLTRLVAESGWDAARNELPLCVPGTAAQARAAGIERKEAERIATHALEITLAASSDPLGRWILSPHPDAASELRWAGITENGLRQTQVDRIFRAGEQPNGPGEDVWWIIDYKTAHADNSAPEGPLPELRSLFAPQLESYARMMRRMRGQDAQIRAGLYYPRMMRFDWWEP